MADEREVDSRQNRLAASASMLEERTGDEERQGSSFLYTEINDARCFLGKIA